MGYANFQPLSGTTNSLRGIRVVAFFEGAKGLLVLLAGFGLLACIHQDIHAAAMRLVSHFHLNPASSYPRIFLDLTERVNDSKLWAMALAAAAYALLRLIEAVGLWFRKKWAEWFAVLTGSIYLPLELFEIMRGVTWPRVTLLAVNLGVVSYLVKELLKQPQHAPPPADCVPPPGTKQEDSAHDQNG
jgi:uncharacterized membrane protein (DUF2068 family)